MRLLICLTALLAVFCTVRSPSRAQGLQAALAIEREVQRIAGARDLWPGFDPLTIPLAVFTGEYTFLFRHPSPPEGFLELEGVRPRAFVFRGRYPGIIANSTAELGGSVTATLLADELRADRDATALAPMALHEAFHAYQRARHPSWAANEGDLFLYPVEDARLLALRRLESGALSRALEAPEVARAACWAKVAVTYRGMRFSRMDAAFSTYERRTELFEGLATYIERLAAGEDDVELPPAGFTAVDVRGRGYATGSALAFLLDHLRPGWQAALEDDDEQNLDEVLEASLRADGLEGTDECAFDSVEIAEAKRRAEHDADAVVRARVARREEFDARAGWRVIVLAADEAPLWPQGFDPLNVERMEGGVLHTRFLRVGNETGELQAISEAGTKVEALTEGLGPHPMFNGIRRVVVVGPSEPEIEEREGQVIVRAPGLAARFESAMVEVTGTEVRIHLARRE